MQGVNRFSPLPDPTGKPNKLETNNTENASTEVQMFNYKKGYDAIIGEVAMNDGGYNSKELDGDPDEMVTQLENLRNKYKGRIPEKLEEKIQDSILECKMQKLARELSNTNYGNKTDQQIEEIMKQKISKLSMKECKYLLKGLEPIYETFADYGQLDNSEDVHIVMQSGKAIALVKSRQEELEPSLGSTYDLSLNE